MRTPLPIVTALLVLGACAADNAPRPDEPDGNTTPTMTTDSVSTFITDSGITRYHVESPLWLIYDNADEPHWHFPHGLHLQRFDNNMAVEANLRADTARFFSRLNLWQLDGNVRLTNTQGDRFLTQQLFWDARTHTVYSDSFIHIERTDRILEGYGFTSNEQITAYTIRRPTGIFPTPTPRQPQND